MAPGAPLVQGLAYFVAGAFFSNHLVQLIGVRCSSGKASESAVFFVLADFGGGRSMFPRNVFGRLYIGHEEKRPGGVVLVHFKSRIFMKISMLPVFCIFAGSLELCGRNGKLPEQIPGTIHPPMPSASPCPGPCETIAPSYSLCFQPVHPPRSSRPGSGRPIGFLQHGPPKKLHCGMGLRLAARCQVG